MLKKNVPFESGTLWAGTFLVFPFTITVTFFVPIHACVREVGLIGLVPKSGFSKELFPCWKIPISI